MNNNKDNIWLDGIMGVITGDALGCSVQFMSRSEIKERGPVTEMEGYGTYNMPVGTWTDTEDVTLRAISVILKDCTEYERKVLSDNMKSLKLILRDNSNKL